MPLPVICQPSQWGLEPGACHTRSQREKHAHTMDKSLSTKSFQRNNAAYIHTVNVVLPLKSHSAHLPVVTSGNGDEFTPGDRNQNAETNIHPNAEISAVPDPVPNPLLPAVLPSIPEQTRRPFDVPETLTGVASSTLSSTRFVTMPNSLLPPSFTASAISSTLSLAPTSRSGEHPPSRQTTPNQVSSMIITLVTLGGAFLVIAILIGVKLWIQPRRRSHPTPSLPILQDEFSPARKMGDESPLFGGKERRLSSQTGSGGVPWTWTQYQSGIPKPAPAAIVSNSGGTGQTAMKRYSRHVDVAPSVTISGTAAKSDGHPSKALSRLSTLSGMVYPGSMYESAGPENIGIAVGYGQGIEYGGTESVGREVSKRASKRTGEKRRSTIYGSPEGLAYTMSPCMEAGDPVGDGGDEDQDDGFLGVNWRGSAIGMAVGTDEPGKPRGGHSSGDKPPRVPSPPVLPSLAQMADYRSPTYSLYGLYSSG